MAKGSKYIIDLMVDVPHRYERHYTKRSAIACKREYDQQWPNDPPCVIYVRLANKSLKDGSK